eukprot:TRINITY_DN2602_c0_g1_i2.p1 TRINITY_DN2602_c0_g1~~TRINITY_DN2602_c0_g1_i2.p1  ORF type:complete len:371 (+),score=30.17 TRINITY_DN2602_c0_g1_i2:159-1271(+)
MMTACLASCGKVVLTHGLEDPMPVMTLSPHKGAINGVTWNHNNQVIASAGADGRIVLSHAGKGNQLLLLEDELNRTIPTNAVAFTSNSQFLASGGNDGIVKLWDLKRRALSNSFKSHLAGITSVAWNGNDTILASSSLSGDIILHNVSSGIPIANFTQKNSQGVRMVRYATQRKNVLASAGNDGTVQLWDITARSTIVSFTGAHSSRVSAIAFSPFKDVLLSSASLDQKVHFFDISERKVVKTLSTESPLTSLAFHADGHTIAVGTLYGQILVYDLRASHNVKNTLKGHDNNAVNFLDFAGRVNLEGEKVQLNESSTSLKLGERNASVTLKENVPVVAGLASKKSSVGANDTSILNGSDSRKELRRSNER